MKIPKTPQAKKRLSLLKDCQNTYGEHDKSSRTAIRWRKSWVNRTYRRDVNQSLGADDLDCDTLNDRVSAIDRHSWRKCADTPLGKKLLQDKTREISQKLIFAANADRDCLDKLARYLGDRDLKSSRVAILMRRARAVTLDRNSGALDLTGEDLALLEDFLDREQPN
jgi:hypothetical protein